jgi:hypothetical protein
MKLIGNDVLRRLAFHRSPLVVRTGESHSAYSHRAKLFSVAQPVLNEIL